MISEKLLVENRNSILSMVQALGIEAVYVTRPFFKRNMQREQLFALRLYPDIPNVQDSLAKFIAYIKEKTGYEGEIKVSNMQTIIADSESKIDAKLANKFTKMYKSALRLEEVVDTKPLPEQFNEKMNQLTTASSSSTQIASSFFTTEQLNEQVAAETSASSHKRKHRESLEPALIDMNVFAQNVEAMYRLLLELQDKVNLKMTCAQGDSSTSSEELKNVRSKLYHISEQIRQLTEESQQLNETLAEGAIGNDSVGLKS